MDRASIKLAAKEAFKANYWKSVLAAFILSLFTTYYSVSSGGATSSQGVDLSGFSSEQISELFAALAVTIVVLVVIGVVLKIFVFNPLEVGGFRFFRKNVEEKNTGLDAIKEGFGDYGRTFVTLFLRDLFLSLWTMLFVIPGLVKTYSYMLVPYILKDNPELSATAAITRSRELMNGHKWEAFVLDLSFIGWYLLSGLTCGILNIFWTEPYRQSARAKFYLALLNK